jgi:ribose transport system substrate-binding protein
VKDKRRLLRSMACFTALASLVCGVAACASSSAPASSSGQGTSQTTACAQAAAKAIVPYEKPLKADVPSTPVDMSSLRGKHIWAIANTTGDPLAILDGIIAAAKAAGVTIHTVQTSLSPSDQVQAINEGIAQHVTGIIQDAGTLAALATSYKAATAAHIPFVDVAATPDPNDPLLYGDYAHLTQSYTLAGALEADGILATTGCKANVVIGALPVIPSQEAITAGTQAEFKKLCPTCSVTVLDIPVTDTPVQVQGLVNTELARLPKTNFFDMNNDFYALEAYPALKAAKVPEASVNCDPSVRNLIAAHDTLLIDICGPDQAYQGWAAFDAIARAINHQPAHNTTFQLLYLGPHSNVNPNNLYPDFGNYQAEFEKVWGIG